GLRLFETSVWSAHKRARVAEDAHPRSVLAPGARTPRILDGAEHALRVGHEDRDAAVAGRERGDAARRPVRIVRIELGGAATWIDEARGDQPGVLDDGSAFVGRPLGAPLAVRDGDGQPRSDHS